MVTEVTATSVALAWGQVEATIATGYRVTYTPANGSCDGAGAGSVLLHGSTNTSLVLTELEEDMLYIIQIFTQGDGTSNRANSYTLTQRTGSSGKLQFLQYISPYITVPMPIKKYICQLYVYISFIMNR